MRVARLVRAARLLPTLVVAGAVAFGATSAQGVLAAAAPSGHAKVVVIVGPVGSFTDHYRAMADEAVVAARRLTDRVVTFYTPDATWAAVRHALQGANIVVYLGHGNGWPSRYSSVLMPLTQDGLGLNPVAGVDDSAHQYFGERWLEKYVRLAPGAVVLLSHLCYASGAAEPGMANPSLNVAVQRVDNYAAGWLATGASAVVAEGHLGPAYYVRALLADGVSPQRAWLRSPTFHHNLMTPDSVRTPGATLFLDPDTAGSGYYRSLALRGTAGPISQPTSQLPSQPSSTGVGDGAGDAVPATLVGPGSGPARLDVPGTPVAGAKVGLDIVFDRSTASRLPKDLVLGATWTWLDSDGAVAIRPQPIAGPAADPAAMPQASPVGPSIAPPGPPSGQPGPSGQPAPSPGTSAAGVPPQLDLVAPEASDSLLVTRPARGTGRHRTVTFRIPARPGLYRLVVTVHDPEGIAYDGATQQLLRPLIVHVTGSLWASYAAPVQLTGTAGEPLDFGLRVANTGSTTWGTPPAVVPKPVPAGLARPHAGPLRPPVEPDPSPTIEPAAVPLVVVRWVGLVVDPLSATAPPAAISLALPTAFVAPGSSEVVPVSIPTPPTAGQYLLLVDLVTADGVSLTASGVPPALIRVFVAPAPATDKVDHSGAFPS